MNNIIKRIRLDNKKLNSDAHRKRKMNNIRPKVRLNFY